MEESFTHRSESIEEFMKESESLEDSFTHGTQQLEESYTHGSEESFTH